MELKTYFFIAGVIFLFDQLTKIISKIFLHNGKINVIGEFFSLQLTHNTGAAFSILQGSNLLLIILTVAIIFFLVYYMTKSPSDRLPLTLVLGGAIGNLADRLIHGSVVDFIDIGFWPVFNFADTAITIGVICLIYQLIKKK